LACELLSIRLMNQKLLHMVPVSLNFSQVIRKSTTTIIFCLEMRRSRSNRCLPRNRLCAVKMAGATGSCCQNVEGALTSLISLPDSPGHTISLSFAIPSHRNIACFLSVSTATMAPALQFVFTPTPNVAAAHGDPVFQLEKDAEGSPLFFEDWKGESPSPSPPPSPKLSFEYKDPELYQHLPSLVDGVTKKEITRDTTLVTLYDGRDDGVDNHLLFDLTGIAVPAVPCQLLLAGGDGDATVLPPTLSRREHGYEMRLTYNKLVSTN